MAEDSGGLAHLDAVLDRERIRRRWKWKDVAQRAGISPVLLRAVRKGAKPMTEQTKTGLQDAYGWGDGAIDRILAGGEPPAPEPVPPHVFERVLRDDVEREMMAITRVPEEERWAFIIERRERLWREGQGQRGQHGLGRTGS
ncbi:hypothetical protein [Amycolatopsis thermoflava]|uniref:hypothetical protein n=1 Tax=Amycolatopsis thermoflava TaxID=84480 RepID=UPI0004090938|nr:hypothetical protein [Amycolatopsis thermoflava]